MEIKEIKLYNYRNYESLNLEFNKKTTIFIGDNAQGKTNILEAIYVLGLTKSYLNVNEKNLINFNKVYSKIEGIVTDNNIKRKLEILINEKGKKVKIDNYEVTKLSNYISKLNVIIFSPDNIRLLKESPSYRRKYLNIEISQLYNSYLNYLNDFNKILKQRNEYLKSISNGIDCNYEYLNVLNEKYVELAINIYIYRKRFVEKINENLEKIYFNITSFNGLKLKYFSFVEDDEKEEMKLKFYQKLKENIKKEIFYKTSLFGPHRDDFSLELDGKNLLLYGSQGQNRCAILALKLAEIPIFKSILNVNPILLLDDVFSELDTKKKNSLIEFIPKDIQTMITTTDLNLINDKLLEDSTVYMIENGKIISKLIHDERKS